MHTKHSYTHDILLHLCYFIYCFLNSLVSILLVIIRTIRLINLFLLSKISTLEYKSVQESLQQYTFLPPSQCLIPRYPLGQGFLLKRIGRHWHIIGNLPENIHDASVRFIVATPLNFNSTTEPIYGMLFGHSQDLVYSRHMSDVI